MKVLRISYKDKELSRFRVTSPLILLGRSPLCDILLRVPGVGSVNFIFEWIGEGVFNVETAFLDEWVMTEVGDSTQVMNERKVNSSVVGNGAIFHDLPLQSGDFIFSWIEDNLVESDLTKKLFTQHIEELKRPNEKISNSGTNFLLEVISLNRDVDAVTGIQHFSFTGFKEWRTPLLSQFNAKPQMGSEFREVLFTMPTDSEFQLLRKSGGTMNSDNSKVTLAPHDMLHIVWKQNEYYFRLVPKVVIPHVRRTIWSDPFYMISTFCIIIAAFGFYLMSRNLKLQRNDVILPPRIAQIQLVEIPAPQKSILPVVKEIPNEVLEKLPEVTEPIENVEHVKETAQQNAIQKSMGTIKKISKIKEKNTAGSDKNLNNSLVNQTGFLAALKRNKNVGTVKANQILDRGIVSGSIKSKSGDFVLEQTSSGELSDKHNEGDILSAASTKLNMKDSIGNESLKVDKGDVLKDGFKADYGVSKESGILDTNFSEMIQPVVQGGLEKGAVQSAIRGFKAEIRTCYEKALRIKSGVGGRIVFKFQISIEGKVTWIQVQKSDVESASLINCVQKVVEGIEFPKAKNKQTTIVVYPFQFAKKGT